MLVLKEISQIYQKWYCRNLRRAIRGYRKIGVTGYQSIRSINEKLVNLDFSKMISNHSFFLGAASSYSELILRQRVVELCLDRFNKALFSSAGSKQSSIVPIPANWICFLLVEGVAIAKIRSQILWYAYVGYQFLLGFLFFNKLALIKIIHFFRPFQDLRPYVYFDALKKSNLPKQGNWKFSRTIITSYLSWNKSSIKANHICHGIADAEIIKFQGISLQYINSPWLLFDGKKNILKFLVGGWCLFIFCIVQLLMGKWSYSFLFKEAIKSYAVRLCDSERLAKEYFFYMANTIYRPAWTYDAENHGCKITLYFYSTYAQPSLHENASESNFLFSILSWPNYVVWDSLQRSILSKSLNSSASFQCVGPIDFLDNSSTLPLSTGNSLVIFPFEPRRPAASFPVTTYGDWFSRFPNAHIDFLRDIIEIASNLGIKILIKEKRDLEWALDRSYKGQRNALFLKYASNLTFLSDDFSASRVGVQALAAISMPFTSTALSVSASGKPSIYYDPTSWIQKNDLAARGMSVLHGRIELVDWLEGLSKNTLKN